MNKLGDRFFGKDAIAKVLVSFIDPIRYHGQENLRLKTISNLNTALLRMKIPLTSDCKIRKTEQLLKYESKEELPKSELESLITKCNDMGLPLNADWVAAISALNVLEAAINKKLEDMGSNTDGTYTQRLDRVANLIKKNEERTISKMIPETLYRGPRQKLDHASHKNLPTATETRTIIKSVMDFMDELFP